MAAGLLCGCAEAHADQPEQTYRKWAETPPMGWNSWDIFGTTVTEKQAKEQAEAMAKYLRPAGYDILTVDIQWYEPNAKGHVYQPGAKLEMDEYGRLQPLLGTVEDGSLTWFQDITENPGVGDTEIWEVFNATGDAHPVHLHLVTFEILGRQEADVSVTERTQEQHNGSFGTGYDVTGIS